jgi:hypothetical protein
MKKTYQLHVEGKHPERLLESIKHDIKKYMRRESKKALPAGHDFWDFDVRLGAIESEAQMVHPKEINARINEVVAGGHTAFYIELLAKAAKRQPRPKLHPDLGSSTEDGQEGLEASPLESHAQQHDQAKHISSSILTQSLEEGH